MRISYDPTADAVYVQLHELTERAGDTQVEDDGTIVDLDAAGNPRGYEFLAVSALGLPLHRLPHDVASALRDFIESGHLNSPRYLEVEVP